jgi:hypothetical protein
VIIKLKLTREQAARFFGIPKFQNSGRTILSQEVDFYPEIHVWCREFLVDRATPYWDVSHQTYFILFREEQDVVNFKLRWW